VKATYAELSCPPGGTGTHNSTAGRWLRRCSCSEGEGTPRAGEAELPALQHWNAQ
jgi:hypothetical protein